jgi:acetolactate synthase-1/2/3 large subunit
MEPFHPEVPESLAERAKKMILKTSNPAIITWRAGKKESRFNSLKDLAHSTKNSGLKLRGGKS